MSRLRLRKMARNKNKKEGKTKSSHVGWGRFLGLKILDIFILKKFLGTYFFATILILAIISMFDITEKLDAFLNAPIKETLFD